MKKKKQNKTEVFQIRLTPAEKKAWEKAAKEHGRSLASWLRWLANQAVRH